MGITLLELVSALPGRSECPPGSERTTITGVVADNRKVTPGALFVAIPGYTVDGHRFIADAVRRGAAAVVCERPQQGLSVPQVVVPSGRQALAYLCAAWRGFPSRSMTMIGVTGTDGKTTTTNLLFSILQAAGVKSGMISTVNAVIGERVLDTGLHTTTPEADEVQGYLAQMRDTGMTHCILEVTSHALEQYRVDAVEFDVAVVTNITHEHLDIHGSYEAYRAAKGRLFEMLTTSHLSGAAMPGSFGKPRLLRTAVLNADDAFSYEYLRAIPVEQQLVYSMRNDAHVQLLAERHAADGMHLSVRTPRGELELSSALIGGFNIANILAAVSAACALGIRDDAISGGVAALRGVPGRMERINAGQSYTALVDFAHTPNALEQCLRTLRPITPGRLIAVFGCAGERDVAKRPMMGRVAAQLADVAIFTAEDPRREDINAILDAMEAGITVRNAMVLRVPDRAEALRVACAMAQSGDTVVACGKGHEQSMCFGVTETPWDDREQLRRAILTSQTR